MLFHFLLLCVVGMVCGEDVHEGLVDEGEYGEYTTWRKEICEKKDQEMYKEIDVCFLMEKKDVTDAIATCIKETMGSEADNVAFFNAGCEDIQLYHKFDDCFHEYTKDPDFRLQLKLTPDIVKCHNDVIEKYSLDIPEGYVDDLAM